MMLGRRSHTRRRLPFVSHDAAMSSPPPLPRMCRHRNFSFSCCFSKTILLFTDPLQGTPIFQNPIELCFLLRFTISSAPHWIPNSLNLFPNISLSRTLNDRLHFALLKGQARPNGPVISINGTHEQLLTRPETERKGHNCQVGPVPVEWEEHTGVSAEPPKGESNASRWLAFWVAYSQPILA